MKKSLAELIDELVTTSNKIYHLIDKVYGDTHSREDAKKIQDLNKYRAQLMSAINEFSKERELIKI